MCIEKSLEEGNQIVNYKIMGDLFSFWSVFVGYFPTINILLILFTIRKSCLECMCKVNFFLLKKKKKKNPVISKQ